MPTAPKIAQLDLRAERLSRRPKLDLGLCGDVRDTLRDLLPLVEAKSDRAFLDAMLEQHQVARRKLRAGGGAAFEVLVRAYGGSLLATARRYLRHEEDARDVVQEALLAAFKAIAGFDGRARLATWLHRITINAALQKLRSRRRRHEQPIEPLLPQFLPDGHQANPAAEWPEPADAGLQRRELYALVHACIDRLREAYRTVLLLRDIEELDTEETARLLGVNPGVVKTRLHRARQALRALLDPHLRGGAP